MQGIPSPLLELHLSKAFRALQPDATSAAEIDVQKLFVAAYIHIWNHPVGQRNVFSNEG